MRWTGTLVLLLVTVAVGAYVSLYELHRPTREELEEQAHEVLDVAPDQITEIRIAAPKLTATLTRAQERWRLTAPVHARADEATVLRLLYFLHPLGTSRVLKGTAAKPLAFADYGLAPPKATLSLTTASGPVTLAFGEATAVGSSSYVQRDGDPAVYVVRGYVFDTLNQSLEQYRAHTVLEIDPAALTRLAVASAQSTYTLERSASPLPDKTSTPPPESWRLTAPTAEAAEANKVAHLISALRGLRAERFVSDAPTPEQLAQWGLTEPASRVTMTLRDVSEPVELLIGGAVPDQAAWRYVKVSTEPGVSVVEASQAEPLWIDPSTLRPTPTPSASPAPSPSS